MEGLSQRKKEEIEQFIDNHKDRPLHILDVSILMKILKPLYTDKGKKQILNTFLMWLDWLKQTPKKTWEKQIKVKAQQIFREINK